MISKEKKAAIMAEYGRTPNDTGSPEVQIAILTARIQELTEHLKENPKDLSRFFSTKYRLGRDPCGKISSSNP